MEKLQAALASAREERSRQTAHHRDRRGPEARMADASVSNHWLELTPFDPVESRLRTNRVVTSHASSEATPFDVLRTKILLQMRKNNWTRLAITSPMPQSGKTTVACNLALGLGRQRDLRAALFDLDLKDPSIHKFFGHKPPHSPGEVLAGEVSFAEQARRIGSNVAISMGHKLEQDPTRLLLDEATAQRLDEIEAAYRPDVMIFDLPSILSGDNARAFLKNVDCALIVARANATRYGQFDTCEREIAQDTNVVGVVLNAYRYSGVPGDDGTVS